MEKLRERAAISQGAHALLVHEVPASILTCILSRVDL